MRLSRHIIQSMVALSTLTLFAMDAAARNPYGPAGLGSNLHRRFKVRHGLQKNTAFYRTPSQRRASGLGILNHSSSASSHGYSTTPRTVVPHQPDTPVFRYVAPQSGYCNPYEVETTSFETDVEPNLTATNLTVTATNEISVRPAPTDAQLTEAIEFADAAFRNGDYRDAEEAISAVIEAIDGPDTDLLQFKSLILFAQGDFHRAAAAAHEAMRAGSGWTWSAVRSHYPTVDVYTAQLRACEAASRREPDTPYLNFLLGYHYLACGHPESACRQLHRALELEPRDGLTTQLIAAVEGR